MAIFDTGFEAVASPEKLKDDVDSLKDNISQSIVFGEFVTSITVF